ncbi:MAG: hypothetical protein RLZZ312_316 [Bacteroidota bacterium]|jgi:endonuclease/exonuclease/phosphatase family metal-dependent hydrolase
MRKTVLILFLHATFFSVAQIKIISWNIQNFGRSKSDSEIAYISEVVKNADLIALQEVVAGYGGSQAVAKLANELNRSGAKWDYVVSDVTTSSAYKAERYAFLWKSKSIKKIGNAWLEQNFELEIDREPFFCTFEFNKKQFTVVNFHAITKKMQPETEIKYFKFLPAQYPNLNLIFMGDFNCPQSHSVFNPLRKMGFESVLKNQKTSLKQSCEDLNCLASEYDNIFYNTSKVKCLNAGLISFFDDFDDFKIAKQISDHVPIFGSFVMLQVLF